ncbi:hypothetical protein Bbelb_232810 [Branchiostoma belcheri]|nr:hypothetical protein Bbelb_232810 [Branchiostoma belcheri]
MASKPSLLSEVFIPKSQTLPIQQTVIQPSCLSDTIENQPAMKYGWLSLQKLATACFTAQFPLSKPSQTGPGAMGWCREEQSRYVARMLIGRLLSDGGKEDLEQVSQVT